jgi:hypothetical protein
MSEGVDVFDVVPDWAMSMRTQITALEVLTDMYMARKSQAYRARMGALIAKESTGRNRSF